MLAVMVALPAATPVTRPDWSTVALVGSLDPHTTCSPAGVVVAVI